MFHPRQDLGRWWCAALVVAGCAQDPSEQSELRSDGPPDVLSVVVARNRFLPSALLTEEPTYCRPNDSKRPTKVNLPDLTVAQVCPDDASQVVETFRNAFPAYWYVRVVFDELLNLASEEPNNARVAASLQPTRLTYEQRASTPPVTLNCNGIDVPYVAFYVGTGTSETWPIGPSIKIKPVDPSQVPANAICEVMLLADAIKDKTGNSPEPSQLGPYFFQLAPIALQIPYGPAAAAYGTSGAIPTLAAGNPRFRINFNHYVDPTTFDASDVKVFRGADVDDPRTSIKECGSGVQVAAKVGMVAISATQATTIPYAATISDAELAGADWAADTAYRVEIGGTPISDVAGGSNILEPTTLCFRTR